MTGLGEVTAAYPNLVSVVIPTRDRAALVGRAIRSVLSQTWPDLELIVVDDGSTDGTSAAVAGVADDRVRLVRSELPTGPGAARNEGIRRARGDWVAFLDSDDEWVPTKLERQLARLKADRSGASVAYCQAEVRDALTRRRFVVPLPPHEGDTFPHLLAGWSPPTASIFLVNRAVLLAAGGFDPALPCREDYDLWLRLAGSGKRFVIVDQPLVIKHEGEWPRITGDPVARGRGFDILDQRWGPVIEGRFGQRARARWRAGARARVDHAHLVRVRDAVRVGDRRAAWRHCSAMARGLPGSGRHLVRGLVCWLVGWHTYAALERMRTRLGAIGRWAPDGCPPGTEAVTARGPRPSTGSDPRGGESAPTMALPSDWIEALTVVAETSRRVGIPYAVVGRLGIALSQGLDFYAVRPPRGVTETGQPQDLDVFLMGPDDVRLRFRTLLEAVSPSSRPMIDIVPIYHEQIHFSTGGITLRYRDIAVSVEPRLFQTFDVRVAGLRVPILHPRTHLHMMGQNPLFRKIRWNIQCLARTPRGDTGFPVLPESAFREFHRFKRAKLRQHHVRYSVMRLRAKLYDRELDGKHDLVLRAKRLLRQRYPRATEFLRHRLG
jgi:hypothetical protein